MADISKAKVDGVTYNLRDKEVEDWIPGAWRELKKIYPTAIELGLRADFVNNVFTRLGDARGLNGGSDFDQFAMYKRRRCNLADDGTVNAYLGDEDYAVDGSNGQVMVEQPKFWYKVVPVQLNGSKLEIGEWWVSDQPLEGYKLHPAFYNISGQEIDAFYEGAYEGYVSSSKLGSISGVTPSGGTKVYTRANFRTYAANRGTGWRQETIWSLSADQILAIIEYGCFNMQDAIGNGRTNASSYLTTGTLNSYGNGTYGTTANETTAVQWRGKENPWGNKYAWVDGINFNGYVPYIANSYSFTDNTSTGYTQLGFNISSSSGTYISAFGYDSNNDWIFIPYTGNGTSSLPVGDGFWSVSSGWMVARSGGNRSSGSKAGLFYFSADGSSSGSTAAFGGRALYVG